MEYREFFSTRSEMFDKLNINPKKSLVNRFFEERFKFTFEEYLSYIRCGVKPDFYLGKKFSRLNVLYSMEGYLLRNLEFSGVNMFNLDRYFLGHAIYGVSEVLVNDSEMFDMLGNEKLANMFLHSYRYLVDFALIYGLNIEDANDMDKMLGKALFLKENIVNNSDDVLEDFDISGVIEVGDTGIRLRDDLKWFADNLDELREDCDEIRRRQDILFKCINERDINSGFNKDFPNFSYGSLIEIILGKQFRSEDNFSKVRRKYLTNNTDID